MKSCILVNLLSNKSRLLAKPKEVWRVFAFSATVSKFRTDHSITEIEEIADQVWEGDIIKQEQFFYDPK